MNLNQKAISEHDLVLIYIENKPGFYARVEKIVADVKPKWWRVKLLMLTVPVNVTTWIIDDEQIRGADFTMGGTPIRIEKIQAPEEPVSSPEKSKEKGGKTAVKPKQARVLSMQKKKI